LAYRNLLVHRVTVKRPTTSVIDGATQYTWKTIASSVPCRLDLSYLRPGKDPQWTPEAGRATDRTGVAFFLTSAPVKVGDRLVADDTGGITGTFLVEGSIDTVQGRHRAHHVECGVKEVPGPQARAS
jgi:hypothetical protein